MYIIDGHNLIPKLPGGSLRDLDDESMLIGLLQAFARAQRKHIHVFFDNAPPGSAGERSFGHGVIAHFVARGLTADDAIRRMLVQQGNAARNSTVITSDRTVQVNARALHAEVLPAEEFVRRLGVGQAPPPKPAPPGGKSAPAQPGKLSDKELNTWYDVFHIDPSQAETPIEPESRKRAPGQRKSSKKRRYGEP
jgi:predicted RNA-binding protein with PIN domain